MKCSASTDAHLKGTAAFHEHAVFDVFSWATIIRECKHRKINRMSDVF